ncbi:hypothetical protein Tco_0244300, partial [Tanacetum coccineum]
HKICILTPESPQDDLIIVTDESKEEEAAKDDTHAPYHNVPEDTSVPPSPSPKDELEQQKAIAKAEVASLKARPSYPDINYCLPTELKELPLKVTELSGEIKELKKHVRDMEIELPRDLNKILTKQDIHFNYLQSYIPGR